jgi:hypothetical protein
VQKVNVGADSALVDPQSQTWAQDQAYVPAAYGYVGASGAYGSSAPVDLALAPELYQTLRQDSALQYRVAVPENGSYRVTLHFAEFVAQAPGERVMSVSIEGVVEAEALDVLALAGPARAYTLSRDLSITDGVLDISLQGVAGKAMLAAVEVTGLQAQGEPTPTPTPTEIPLTLQLDLPAGARLLSEP